MSSNSDSGLSINRDNFDMEIGSNGDVAISEDGDELTKDLALQLKLFFNKNVKGDVIDKTEKNAIEAQIRDIISDDARVRNVNTVSVQERKAGTVPSVELNLETIYGSSNVDFDPTTL